MDYSVSTLRNSFIEVFSHKRNVFFGLSCAFIFGVVLYIQSRIPEIFGNLGLLYATTEILLLTIISILFGINITLLVDRIKLSRQTSKASVGSTSAASLLGILFSGCTACGLTLASYLGLGSFATLLPWYGNEIKLVAIALLLYSIFRLAQPANCAVEPLNNVKKISRA